MRKLIWDDCNGQIDTNGIYECPMVRKNSYYPNELEDIVQIKFVPYKFGYGYNLIPLNNNYKQKFFYDVYIGWLLYTGYIKRVK